MPIDSEGSPDTPASKPRSRRSHHGLGWDEMQPGFRYETSRRTISQVDIVTFVAYAGFNEPLFYDMEHVRDSTSFGRRIAPGLLTLSYAEGLVIQSGVIHSTAIALLAIAVRMQRPVFEDDTIHVDIEVVDSRPTSKGPERGVVTTLNCVLNQAGEVVIDYDVTRLLHASTPAPT